MRAHTTKFLMLIAAGAFVPAWFSAASAAGDAIGFVNIPAIMEKAPQARAAREKLQQEFSARRKRLDECGKEWEDLDRMVRREGRDMEKSRRDRMIDKVRKKRRECEDLQEEFEADFNKRRSEELGELQKQISGVIKSIAEKRDLKLIVGPPVIYVDDQMNLTEEVLNTLSGKSR